MNCPVCNSDDFQKIRILTYDSHEYGDSYSVIRAAANISEFPKGNFSIYEKKDHRGDTYYADDDGNWIPNPKKGTHIKAGVNWTIEPKVCLSCGYIAMFLPIEEMRAIKTKKAVAAKKKKEAAAAAKKKKEAAAAERKKAERKAEKERLKKRLAELEDED